MLLFIALFHVSSYAQNCSGMYAVSGGGSKNSNYLRYYDNLDRITDIFGDCPRKYSLAAGNNDKKVITDLDAEDEDSEFVSRRIIDQNAESYSSATTANIDKNLTNWSAIKNSSSKPFIFYTTDHGGKAGDLNTPGTSNISLWKDKRFEDESKADYKARNSLDPFELNKMFRNKPANKPVILLQDQCYGGGMLHSLLNDPYDYTTKINGCGIAAAQEDQLAWNGGGVLRNMQEMVSENGKGANTYEQLFERLENESLERSDDLSETIRSLPVLSSEFYAKRFLEIDTKNEQPLARCRQTVKSAVNEIERFANNIEANQLEAQIVEEIKRVSKRAKEIAVKECQPITMSLGKLNRRHDNFIRFYETMKTHMRQCVRKRSKYISWLSQFVLQEKAALQGFRDNAENIKNDINKHLQSTKQWFKSNTPNFIDKKNTAQFERFYKHVTKKENRDKFNKNKIKYFNKFFKDSTIDISKVTPTELNKLNTYYRLKNSRERSLKKYQEALSKITEEEFERIVKDKNRKGTDKYVYSTYFMKIAANAKTSNDYKTWLSIKQSKSRGESYDEDDLKKYTNIILDAKNVVRKNPLPFEKNLNNEAYEKLIYALNLAKDNPRTFIDAQSDAFWNTHYSNVVTNKAKASKIAEEKEVFKCWAMKRIFDQKEHNGCMLVKNKVLTLKALKRMIDKGDNTAMKKYLETVSCERSSF